MRSEKDTKGLDSPQTGSVDVESVHLPRYDQDQLRLRQLGKEQVLKRNFGFISMLGFSCTIMVTWLGMLVVFLQGFSNGGPAGLVYGFIGVSVGTVCLFTSLGELASMAPTAGGQYYWVALLAPKSSRRFLSYVTGWLTVLGWQAVTAAGSYLCGTQIQGVVILNYPDYIAKGWHGTLLFWACIATGVVCNTLFSSALPKMESMVLVLYILGFFAIIIPLVSTGGPKSSAKEVFTTFVNGGQWPTDGLSFFVGIIGAVFAFLGTDAAIHMSEEIHNAAVVVPRCMLVAIVINGLFGFGMLLAVLFFIGDIETVLSTPPLTYPYMPIFLNATGSLGGATAMIGVCLLISFFAVTVQLTTSSRMYWSFAGDKGLPFSKYISHYPFEIRQGSTVPLNAIALSTLVACLLALINIGSSVAFNDVISLTISGLYSSYLICLTLLLWRRSTNFIKSSAHESTDLSDGIDNMRLIWGPFHLPGVWGIINNGVAWVFTVITLFFSFFPPATPVTPATMNYNALVFGSVVLFSIIYYSVYAKDHFRGPFASKIDVVEAVPKEAGDSTEGHAVR
ncbi:MAG: hypothetical protein Q9220_000231 [cf. Caloplaca sp. 1 TL-2023]